jgi:hypothetical protein
MNIHLRKLAVFVVALGGVSVAQAEVISYEFSGEVVRYECSTECFDPFWSVIDQATEVVPFVVIVNFDDEAGTFERNYPTTFFWRGIVELSVVKRMEQR